MLVPAILIVPAFISGISIWNSWGPHWLLVSIAVTAALLALLIDYQRAVRWALVGILLGLVTSPILLLLPQCGQGVVCLVDHCGRLADRLSCPPFLGRTQPAAPTAIPEPVPQSEPEKALDRLLSNVSPPPKA